MKRLRIALYHCLPPGGAVRMMAEVVSRSAAEHDYTLFTVDLGTDDPFGGAGAYRDPTDLLGALRAVRSVDLPLTGAARCIPTATLREAIVPARVAAAEAAVADGINHGGFDLALVQHSVYTQTPTLLPRLRIPSVFVCHEPRRGTFEAALRRRPRTARAWGGRVFENVLGAVDKRAMAGAHVVACNSYFSKEAIFRAYAIDADVCYPGVDHLFFHPSANLPRRNAVVAVGSLWSMKGHDLVIRSLGLVERPYRPSLDIVYESGSAAAEADLRHLAVTAGVDVTLHRGLGAEGLRGLYQTAIATICAARLEPFGLTTLESLACGTPVVAIREGGYREVVSDPVNGVLVDRGEESIAAGIVAVLGGAVQGSTQDIRDSVIPTWTWESTVARLHELYSVALTRPMTN